MPDSIPLSWIQSYIEQLAEISDKHGHISPIAAIIRTQINTIQTMIDEYYKATFDGTLEPNERPL